MQSQELLDIEHLLQEPLNRFSLFPIQYPLIWDFYKNVEASLWTVEEVDLAGDMRDWNSMNDGERFFVSNILSFFNCSDSIVNDNLLSNFSSEIYIPEVRCVFGFQIAIENIHSEMYSTLIDEYIKDPIKKEHLFNGISTIDCVKQKAEWALKWTDTTNSFAERLVGFSIMEGLFFSSSFCSIFWLKKRNLLPGLCFSNELISRDEGLHCDFSCLLYSMLKNKLTKERVYDIMMEAVQIEKNFVTKSLPVSLIGMNSKLMSEYIEFCADRLLVSLGYPKLYNALNPFDWMDLISLSGKTNFFEKRVGEYSKAGVGVKKEEMVFSLNVDF